MKRHQSILLILALVNTSLYGQLLLKVADLFRNPIEFRTPIGFIPLEIKTGLQLLGLGKYPVFLDSTESSCYPFSKFANRLCRNFELELAKINFLQWVIPQNFVDLPTGIGVRFTDGFGRTELPSNWIDLHPIHREKLFIAPHIREFNIDQALIFQWKEHWAGYFNFGYGFTHATSYVTTRRKLYLAQDGNTYTYTLGVKYITRIEHTLKEGWGIELNYTHGKMKPAKDKYNISPILGLNLNNLTINFTYSILTGGRRTIGDEAKALYKAGDYIEAKTKFETFLKEYPRHPKKFKAQWMIEKCNRKIPYQECLLAEEGIKNKNYLKATDHLQVARTTEDSQLLQRVDKNFQTIISWFQKTMDSLLTNNQVEEAANLLSSIEEKNIPDAENIINLYWSEIWFHRGVVLTQHGMWIGAINAFDRAIVKNPSIRERVNPWLKVISNGYINDANLAIDIPSIPLALESLRQATSIRPDVKVMTLPYIQTLEDGINYLKREAAKKKLRETLANIFNPPPPPPKPTLGMSSEKLVSTIGEPIYRDAVMDVMNRYYELWVYYFAPYDLWYLYFLNGKLYKIEYSIYPGVSLEE